MPLTPGGHMLENYYRAIFVGGSRASREPVGQMLMNSFISAIGIAVGKIFISILSAYAVVYFRFPFRKTAFWIIFITLMLPVEVRIYPTYKVVADLHMLDTYAGLILPLIASATGTLLFRQFFMTIPEELLEASRIDGAGPFRFFWDTLLPLSVTTIAALFVIQFIYGWNQYLWPLLITTQDSMQTIVTGIKKMLYTTDELAEWQLAMATAILAMLPPVAVVVFMQRLFVRGLVETEKVSVAMANVTLRNVRKTYAGGFEAIKGIDFDVGDGQFCVLVGPSGCGKSTLLRMVAGLETITGGEIDIGGRVVNQIEPAERDIAMVFQNYALYPHMSVYNNMAYGLRNRGMAEPEIKTRVEEAARILELGAMLERKPRQLSGGQRQRVAMGRAIVRQPKVFLFDEPLSNLDAKLRIAMRVEIRKLQRRPQHDLDLRHPRPARGDDARRYPGGDERRPGRADRQSARHLPEARDHLRRLLHRRAADEPDAAALG